MRISYWSSDVCSSDLNGARHGCGGRMHIRLVLVPSENAAELTMEIEDQAGEITIDPDHPGRGLLNIHDRADAIGAEYTFDPLNGTPRHRVHLWVALPGAQVGARSAASRAGKEWVST